MHGKGSRTAIRALARGRVPEAGDGVSPGVGTGEEVQLTDTESMPGGAAPVLMR
jgi:hypothetical protein